MCFNTSFNTPETCTVTTQDTPPEKNLYKLKVRTNSCKQIIAYVASVFCDSIVTVVLIIMYAFTQIKEIKLFFSL